MRFGVRVVPWPEKGMLVFAVYLYLLPCGQARKNGRRFDRSPGAPTQVDRRAIQFSARNLLLTICTQFGGRSSATPRLCIGNGRSCVASGLAELAPPNWLKLCARGSPKARWRGERIDSEVDRCVER